MNEKPTKPTFYFIGVTTTKSSIIRVFPEWAKFLGLGDCQIKGIDCKWHDELQVYRDIVDFIKNDSLSLGALVTTHKLDLFAAAKDMFDEIGYYTKLLGEVSCISKRDGKLIGHAKDPITSGLSMQAFVSENYWKDSGAEILFLGAGGSSLALTAYIMEQNNKDNWPSRMVVTNRSIPRLEEMKKIHIKINHGITMEYIHTPKAEDNDAVVSGLKPGSLVINATGLGKDAPGSPLTDAAVFPMNGIAWDFNYRGDLIFLDQAMLQKQERNLNIQDGWRYFIHGWTRVIAEVFNIEIPTSGEIFENLSTIAANVRK